ncbi:MAG: acyltransferase [Acidobacteria bacterium]|nr:acyltransferase [Acidobacteriota bacterium]
MIQRKIKSRERVAGLDTLRALAILLVMTFHLRWLLPDGFAPVGRIGWMGVDLFFVLSGYLIGAQFFKPMREGSNTSPLSFYRSRAYRILPVYLAVLALYVVWPAWREEPGISPLWQFLTFTESLFVDYSKNQAFSHVWSLCVEEHFYLLLPLIALGLAIRPSIRKTIMVLGLLVALGVAARSYEYFHVLLPIQRSGGPFSTRYIEGIYYPTYMRLDSLLAGVSLALIKVFRPSWWAIVLRHANAIFLGGTAVLACTIWIFADRFGAAGTVIGFPMLALGFAMLVASASDARCWFGRLRIPGAATIAILAYTLYLTHKEAAHLDGLYFPRIMDARDWHTVVLIGVSCLVIAALLHAAIERPFLALRDRRKRSREILNSIEATEPAI